ncbi:hypothetical protein [Aerobium aerolatum]|uniref:Uncharacterized protein n=1 Tax=Aquamicrobium aerolatum DSM 21857 TaxID=1121003 RepID=A0A1I3SER4_9HYPH|nr:hypothetical protein [Aquamicrobium aerolatum]SFJ57228.1 hypothetical protein SAMN03080618_03349 [Aquamicrobium aerolatum DSM 21857]
MTDRSHIMKAAWRLYRNTYEMFCKVQFNRNGFRWALTEAWRRAKAATRNAAIPLDVKQVRAGAIRAEIDSLKFKSFQINTTPIQARLEAELSALAA